MTTPRTDPRPTYIALESLERAIRRLSEPIGTVTEFNEYGNRVTDMYPAEAGDERLRVTEDLIGASFVVAQTYLRVRQSPSSRDAQIKAIANYWKHRDEWDDWSGTGLQANTIKLVKALGATPPVRVGQLTELVQKVFGEPFSADALWRAMH